MKHLLTFAFSCIIAVCSFGQTSQKSSFFVQVVLEDEATQNRLNDAKISVFENDFMVSTNHTDSLGSAFFSNLNTDTQYTLTVSHSDYVTQTITVNTLLKADIPTTILVVKAKLFKPKPHENFSFLLHHPTVNYWFDTLGTQQYNPDYVRHVQQMIQYCKGGATYPEVKTFYAFIDTARTHETQKSFELALAYYNKAKIIIDEKEINDLISYCKAYQNLEIEKQEIFDDFISTADAFFDQRNYTAALSKYRSAQSIKPNHNYVSKQIQLCESNIKKAAYQTCINKADELFNNKSFKAAKKMYEAALEIQVNAYPKGQIKICNTNLEAEQK